MGGWSITPSHRPDTVELFWIALHKNLIDVTHYRVQNL
jgi:hypothetical protein